MPCGARARLIAYVAYRTLAFAERDVLIAALADAGYGRVEAAPAGIEAAILCRCSIPIVALSVVPRWWFVANTCRRVLVISASS